MTDVPKENEELELRHEDKMCLDRCKNCGELLGSDDPDCSGSEFKRRGTFS